jgi:1-acyl-sn-glycerol-3-phosphate acyltransferase
MAIPIGERRLPVYKLIKNLSAFVLRPFFRLQVEGHANIPEKGPFLLLPKHQRWEDIPLLSISMERPLYYIAKYELFRKPLLRLFLSSLGGLPLNRMNPSESIQSLRKLLDLLKNGQGIVIFPEGTYYKGSMGKTHKRLINMILSRHRAPMIPCGINYLKGDGRINVKIEFGRPVLSDSEHVLKDCVELALGEMARLSGFHKTHIGEGTDVGT